MRQQRQAAAAAAVVCTSTTVPRAGSARQLWLQLQPRQQWGISLTWAPLTCDKQIMHRDYQINMGQM